MKKIIFLILFTFHLYGQINSAKVKYNLIIGQDEKISQDERMGALFEKAQNGSKKISFSLVFNKKASLFSMNEMIEDEDTSLAKIFSGANSTFYTEVGTEKKIKQTEGAFGKFIINYTHRTDWNLENESKLINSYLCYKATSELIVTNSKGTFKFPVTAWYCPSIPFSYGPNGYDGLPGLILELQERFTVYGVEKIDLSTNEIVIEKPTKGKIVTQEEFNEIVKKPPTF